GGLFDCVAHGWPGAVCRAAIVCIVILEAGFIIDINALDNLPKIHIVRVFYQVVVQCLVAIRLQQHDHLCLIEWLPLQDYLQCCFDQVINAHTVSNSGCTKPLIT
ncbi:MAG: hypothetical protein P8X79_21590, partial [Reinekea sp.]